MIGATATTLLIAVGVDGLLGELPNRWHPVAWMGTAIGAVRTWCSDRNPAVSFLSGSLLVAVGVAASIAAGLLIEQMAPPLLHGAVLSTMIGVRSLATAAIAVRDPLAAGDLQTAREQLAYHLVSRDTTELDTSDVSAAAIESVAENSSDSVVAPLLFYVVGGLPAAISYRFVNTCDAMVGYRTPSLEWFGKPAARLDDLLNLLPARLTVLFLAAASGSIRGFAVWRTDAAETPSPNGGHPMSMAAGILGVRLAKPGVYVLGKSLRRPGVDDLSKMLSLYRRTVLVAVVVLTGFAVAAPIVFGPALYREAG